MVAGPVDFVRTATGDDPARAARDFAEDLRGMEISYGAGKFDDLMRHYAPFLLDA